ncbi:MAG: type I-B CRISPR-associated protein Cas7/Csh2 [Acidobacteria bacterium]|nr:type I-B CRISPR-associated protein Cas7/Csh2 [Acidobacteriota bacterium]
MINKSEILFLYESTYSMPNGDPFTGEQRYDDETKRVLVSDVRIKRFIRDYFHENGKDIYVGNPDPDNKMTGGQRFKMLFEKRADKNTTARDFALSLIDVRLFGAVIPIQQDKAKKKTEEEGENVKAFNLTGAVQFAMLNPSLNTTDLRIHQNTSTLISDEKNKQGAIGTTTVVPYSVNQIHGWINPFSAKHTGLTDEDIVEMFKALWESVNNANTRTKSNQNSLLLIHIVYAEPNKKLYGVDRLIKLVSEKRDEQIRSSDDYQLDFSALTEIADSDKISAVSFYTEKTDWKNLLALFPKFTEMKI